jgi:steroid delta-isomerase-like uncharacterized protein
MTPDERKGLLRRAVDELWNSGNLDICDDLYAENCSFHDPSFPIDGITGLKQHVRELRAANPDLHLDVHDVLMDGDLSADRWTMGATARGEFRGIPATGKTYVMTGTTVAKWEGDRIVEEWINYDLAGALRQLGLMPEAAQTARQETTGR